MTLQEGKEKFIQSWGTLGSHWGISRTMAQVHALLLISPHCLNADQIMEELKISRGNSNMNLRALIDWGLVYKQLKPGDRKEYFSAEKDMWKVVQRVIIQRKKRELEPMLQVINQIIEVESTCPESEAFYKTIRDIKLFSNKADKALEKLSKSDTNWFLSTFMKII